jgi:hypothetical protein
MALVDEYFERLNDGLSEFFTHFLIKNFQ